MTKQRAAELAPVIAAYGAGKSVQIYQDWTDKWVDLDSPDFDASGVKYRVKPEPREWVCIECQPAEITEYGGKIFASGQGGIISVNVPSGYSNRVIRVREIL